MSDQDQEQIKVQSRGFLKSSQSSLKEKLELAELYDDSREVLMADLIREDWLDTMGAFYFPRLSKVLTDERIKDWIESMRAELTEDG